MKNISITLFILLFFSMRSAFAQVNVLNEGINPLESRSFRTSPGLPARLAGGTLSDQLDYVFDSLSAETQIKGWSAALQLPDGSVWERASGLAKELPETENLTTDHLLAMGSITKSFIAATMLLLQEEGLLHITDSIGRYLGPYPNINRKATIKHLLGHRSGFNDYLNENPASIVDIFAYPDSIWVTDTILHHYVLSPNFSPGNWWSYSNTNYLLAERIIEIVTGKRWYEVVRERILDPYDLEQTFAYPFESFGSIPFSNVWLDVDQNGTVEDLQGSGISMDGFLSMAGGAGCLLTTPEDLAKFSTLLYGGYILADTTLTEMQKRQTPMSIDLYYGLGTLKLSLPQNIINWGHDGNVIYKSIAMYMPSIHTSLAVQQNDNRLVILDGTVKYDLYDVFLTLLDTYLNYEEPVATEDLVPIFDQVTLYPNPTFGKMHLNYVLYQGGEVQVDIYSLEGEHIQKSVRAWKSTGTNVDVINTNGLPDGLYYLKLSQGDRVISKPFIVMSGTD